MKMYYCYEDCLHGGQLFMAGKFYPFQSESQLPKRHPKKKGGKETIGHFEEVMQPDSTDEKEIEAKAKQVKNSWGIRKLKSEIETMEKIKDPKPADIVYITKLQMKIASIEGNLPIAPGDVRATRMPDLKE